MWQKGVATQEKCKMLTTITAQRRPHRPALSRRNHYPTADTAEFSKPALYPATRPQGSSVKNVLQAFVGSGVHATFSMPLVPPILPTSTPATKILRLKDNTVQSHRCFQWKGKTKEMKNISGKMFHWKYLSGRIQIAFPIRSMNTQVLFQVEVQTQGIISIERKMYIYMHNIVYIIGHYW